jgi:hypothetical protein
LEWKDADEIPDKYLRFSQLPAPERRLSFFVPQDHMSPLPIIHAIAFNWLKERDQGHEPAENSYIVPLSHLRKMWTRLLYKGHELNRQGGSP